MEGPDRLLAECNCAQGQLVEMSLIHFFYPHGDGAGRFTFHHGGRRRQRCNQINNALSDRIPSPVCRLAACNDGEAGSQDHPSLTAWTAKILRTVAWGMAGTVYLRRSTLSNVLPWYLRPDFALHLDSLYLPFFCRSFACTG